MLSLFLRKSSSFDPTYTKPEYSRFDLVRRRYLEELSKIKDYYRNRDRAVNNRHVIARIINTIVPSIYLDDIEYFKIISADAIYTAKQFNIVSNIHTGKILDSVFYGNNSKELLLYTNNSLDPYGISTNWKNIDSLRIVYSNNTNLDFNIPFNTKDFLEPTLTVIEVDLVTVMMQYKYWALERLKDDHSTNPNVFVATILIPNMLDNMLDITIFNRYLELQKHGGCKPFVIKHPFNVLDFSRDVDRILLDIIKHTTDKAMPLEQIINIIPTVVNKDMLSALRLKNNFFTRQSYWTVWLSRIKYISSLLAILGKKGISRNRIYVNVLPVEIRMLQNRNTDLYSKLEEDLLEDFMDELNKIKNIVGTR